MRRRALLAASSSGASSGGGYTPIDYVTFDGSTIFDTGLLGEDGWTIRIKFKRTDTASNVYLYGVSTGQRLTANLAQSGYWRYGEGAYPTFNTKKTDETEAEVTPTRTKVGSYSKTYSASDFTTKFTVPLGGHTPSSGVPTPQFKGYVYYFQIEYNGIMLLDWIPAIEDGVEGFWDKVTKTFVKPL